MIIFLTSLPHPHNCGSYEQVLSHLAMTVHSVNNQDCGDYRLVVVCNEPPDDLPEENTDIVVVDFPPPSKHGGPTTGMHAIRLDRGTKYVIGSKYAERYTPQHIMFIDADDLVNRRVASWVKQGHPDQGWYAAEGYGHRVGTKRVYPISDFFKVCGTSIIHPARRMSVPGAIGLSSSVDDILSVVGRRRVELEFGSHRFAPMQYERSGVPLKPLPFRGAIWMLGTGENHSGRPGREGTTPLDESLIAEFGFPLDGMST